MQPSGFSFPYRINRFLAQAGLGSRRKMEEFILQGRVSLNGKTITKLSQKVSSQDKVYLDGQLIRLPLKFCYYVLHKPRGCVVSRTSQRGERTIYSLLPPRLHSLKYAGRLDKESRGLIILSDDGNFLQTITHARFSIPKRYRVFLDHIPRGLPQRLCAGVHDGHTLLSVAEASVLSHEKKLIRIVLTEGRKRHIRRMLQSFGIQVLDLYRYSIGDLDLDKLAIQEGKFLPFVPSQFFML